jgi:hypothetical protein
VVDFDRRVNFATFKTYSWGPIEWSTHWPFAAARTRLPYRNAQRADHQEHESGIEQALRRQDALPHHCLHGEPMITAARPKTSGTPTPEASTVPSTS